MPGVAKVVDFGSGEEHESRRRSGVETAAKAVDANSDLYALRALADFALTRTSVFEDASIVAVCAHHLHTQPGVG